MTKAPRLPSTAERRLVEDIFEAFQFDPAHTLNLGNRELALGSAAKILRSAFELSDGEISIIIRCSEKSVPGFIAHAERICANSAGIRNIVEKIRADATPPPPAPKQKPEPKEKKPKESRPLPPMPAPIAQIARSVSDALGVTVVDLVSSNRGLKETNARFVALAIGCATTTLRPEEVGAYFRRDISLVKLARRRVASELSRGRGPLCRDVHIACAALGIDPAQLKT